MSPDRAALQRALDHGETQGGSVEFKERLTRDVHLEDGRRESLAAQLRHRILSGDGEATYVVGVTDDGGLAGVPPESFSESMDVLSLLAEEAGAHIEDVETWGIGGDGDEGNAGSGDGGSAEEGDDEGIVGVATLREGSVLVTDDEHIVVGTAGHVDHGKSTLVGSLVTGQSDGGEGEEDHRHCQHDRPKAPGGSVCGDHSLGVRDRSFGVPVLETGVRMIRLPEGMFPGIGSRLSN